MVYGSPFLLVYKLLYPRSPAWRHCEPYTINIPVEMSSVSVRVREYSVPPPKPNICKTVYTYINKSHMEKKYGLKSNIDVINNIVNLLLTKSETFKIMNLFSEVIKTI